MNHEAVRHVLDIVRLVAGSVAAVAFVALIISLWRQGRL